MPDVYTLGYAGWTVEQVIDQVADLGAVLVDIRLNPYSTKPGFHHQQLRSQCHKSGVRYVHVGDLGNVNHEGGPIQIQNPVLGLAQLQGVLGESPVVLMCGCADVKKCHRRIVAEMLGLDAAHLDPPKKEIPKPDLFDPFFYAIALWQPWASLCVIHRDGVAEKQYETRHWRTPYRGLLLIHAAKRWGRDQREMCFQEPFRSSLRQAHDKPSAMPFGALIGSVELVDCVSTNETGLLASLPAKELAFGNYSPNRFAWRFRNPRRFEEPIPFIGRQQLFKVPRSNVQHVL